MSIDLVSAWILSTMLSIVPCEKNYYVPTYALESVKQCESRYEGISRSIAEVVYHPNSKPLWGGRYARARTAITIITIMYFESGFRRDVDMGIARRRTSRYGWNDYGRSWCMMQINLGKRYEMIDGKLVDTSVLATDEGWSGRELLADRRKCIAAGLNILRKSFRACPGLPFSQKLRVYATGSCEKGADLSSLRMAKIAKYYSENKPAFRDSEIEYGQIGYSCSENNCIYGSIDSSWFSPFLKE